MVKDENKIIIDKPDYVIILAWHLTKRIISLLLKKGYKGNFITPLPKLKILRNENDKNIISKVNNLNSFRIKFSNKVKKLLTNLKKQNNLWNGRSPSRLRNVKFMRFNKK